jgi:UDP-galactopyranose mutase
MKEVQALVIGGGPSGLAVAYGLQGNTLVLETEGAVGGLCRSVHHGGGVFDIGGHSFHTPYPEVHELVQSLLNGRPQAGTGIGPRSGLYTQQRDARVYTAGVLIPYPFQQFFDRIPDPEVVRMCAEGLRNAPGTATGAENLEEHIIRAFGRGIAAHFMLPYNRKLWARDLKRISCEWSSERVAAPKGEREACDAAEGRRQPLEPDTQVGYPQAGGYEEIYKSFVPHLPDLKLNSAAVHIDPHARLATTDDDQQYRWEFLVSTIPLPILVRIVAGTPARIRALAAELAYLSLRVELLLVGRQLDTSMQRVYVADPGVPPHKIVLNHNSSAYLRRRPCHAIMAEVSLSPHKSIEVHEIATRTTAFLCEIGVLRSPEDIAWHGHVDVTYAYPVYTHQRPALVQEIKDWMAQHHIYTSGRFGDWEYINSDRCVLKGLALARELRRRYSLDTARKAAGRISL